MSDKSCFTCKKFTCTYEGTPLSFDCTEKRISDHDKGYLDMANDFDTVKQAAFAYGSMCSGWESMRPPLEDNEDGGVKIN